MIPSQQFVSFLVRVMRLVNGRVAVLLSQYIADVMWAVVSA